MDFIRRQHIWSRVVKWYMYELGKQCLVKGLIKVEIAVQCMHRRAHYTYKIHSIVNSKHIMIILQKGGKCTRCVNTKYKNSYM